MTREILQAFVFPGQGTQRIGMAEGLFSHKNSDISVLAHRTYEEAGDILGEDLESLCLIGPDEKLDRPRITQPAILVTSIAALRVLGYYGFLPDVVAGHSLGEFAALVAAEALSFEQAVRLVSARGEFMELAGRQSPGGMAAILGLTLPEVEEICRESGAEVAIVNSETQVVISGKKGSIAYVVEKLGNRRAREIRVSVAAHSSLMEPARQKMELLLREEPIADPKLPFIQNVTGNYAERAEQVRRGLAEQLTGRVLWLGSVWLMSKSRIRKYIEVGPGEVLTRLIRRILPNDSVNTWEKILAELG